MGRPSVGCVSLSSVTCRLYRYCTLRRRLNLSAIFLYYLIAQDKEKYIAELCQKVETANIQNYEMHDEIFHFEIFKNS